MGDQVTPHPYRPLVFEVESIEAKRARLRQHWAMTLLSQASPAAAAAERAAWKAYSDALREGS